MVDGSRGRTLRLHLDIVMCVLLHLCTQLNPFTCEHTHKYRGKETHLKAIVCIGLRSHLLVELIPRVWHSSEHGAEVYSGEWFCHHCHFVPCWGNFKACLLRLDSLGTPCLILKWVPRPLVKRSAVESNFSMSWLPSKHAAAICILAHPTVFTSLPGVGARAWGSFWSNSENTLGLCCSVLCNNKLALWHG